MNSIMLAFYISTAHALIINYPKTSNQISKINHETTIYPRISGSSIGPLSTVISIFLMMRLSAALPDWLSRVALHALRRTCIGEIPSKKLLRFRPENTLALSGSTGGICQSLGVFVSGHERLHGWRNEDDQAESDVQLGCYGRKGTLECRIIRVDLLFDIVKVDS